MLPEGRKEGSITTIRSPHRILCFVFIPHEDNIPFGGDQDNNIKNNEQTTSEFTATHGAMSNKVFITKCLNVCVCVCVYWFGSVGMFVCVGGCVYRGGR